MDSPSHGVHVGDGCVPTTFRALINYFKDGTHTYWISVILLYIPAIAVFFFFFCGLLHNLKILAFVWEIDVHIGINST